MKFNNYKKYLGTAVVFLGLVCSFNSFAGSVNNSFKPKSFTTRNFTPYQSNAKVKFSFSPFPTPAGTPTSPTVKSVSWVGLRMICGFDVTECEAKIYMKTDRPESEHVYVGTGKLDIATGDITPKELVNNGFRLTSPEPGVIEIREVATRLDVTALEFITPEVTGPDVAIVY
jgi:hypothetical protein